MATRRTRRSTRSTESTELETKVTAEETNEEVKSDVVKEEAPALPTLEAKDIQEKVSKSLEEKDGAEDPFRPTANKNIEKEAQQIAKNQNFDYNRGTAIGARLMARAQQRFNNR